MLLLEEETALLHGFLCPGNRRRYCRELREDNNTACQFNGHNTDNMSSSLLHAVSGWSLPREFVVMSSAVWNAAWASAYFFCLYRHRPR